MALNNYSNLKAAIVNWSHRPDVATVFDDMISLLESDLYETGSSLLRVREMISVSATTVMTAGQDYIAIPSDYLDTCSITVEYGGETYQLKSWDRVSIRRKSGSGRPSSYTITDRIEFDVTPDAAYAIRHLYYARPTSISSSSPTNDVLARYPSIYLHGLQAAAALYAGEIEDASIFEAKFINSVRQANKHDQRGRMQPGSSLRINGPTP